MATYAAYRHVELDKVGCGKRSIMKPPGGDCHDIFGADFHGTPSHHRVLKPPGGGTSALFAPISDEAVKPRPNPTGNQSENSHAVNGVEGKAIGSYEKSGSAVEPPIQSVQNESSSPIPTRDSVFTTDIKNLVDQEESKRRKALTRNCVTGEGCQTTDHFVIRVHRQRDGNPVTGEGYDTPETQPPVPQRARIPPGGYSSGLW